MHVHIYVGHIKNNLNKKQKYNLSFGVWVLSSVDLYPRLFCVEESRGGAGGVGAVVILPVYFCVRHLIITVVLVSLFILIWSQRHKGIATNVGKYVYVYEGNQEGERFYTRTCAGSRSDSIECCLCPLWFERDNVTVREYAPWTDCSHTCMHTYAYMYAYAFRKLNAYTYMYAYMYAHVCTMYALSIDQLQFLYWFLTLV